MATVARRPVSTEQVPATQTLQEVQDQLTQEKGLRPQTWILLINRLKKSGKSSDSLLALLQNAIQVVPPPSLGASVEYNKTYHHLWRIVKDELKGSTKAQHWLNSNKNHENLVKNGYFYCTWALYLSEAHQAEEALAVIDAGLQAQATRATELQKLKSHIR